jgi:hypothetical protein
MNRRIYIGQMRIILILCIIAIGISCKKQLPEIKWTEVSSITDKSKESPQNNIPIDIYIDATTSMEGFAVGELSVYSQFIDQLEASALAAWKSADIKYYKFGTRTRAIKRDEFLNSKNDKSFYRETGFLEKTYIDNVIKNTDSKRLSVVITDLFQDAGDVNAMVDKIKVQCFSKNVLVGILGIRTEFDGKIFDFPDCPMNGYTHKTKGRPFYALVFGEPIKMEKLFEALQTTPFVKENQIILISNEIMKLSNVSILKTRESKFVNKKAPHMQGNNSYDFSMKEKGKEARFNFEVTIEKNSHCVDFKENLIEAVVYKKSITDSKNANPESVLTNDIKFENIIRQGNKITAILVLNNEDPVGNYSYQIYLQPNQLNGFALPGWIKDFSTDNPVPNTPSMSQTFNLEKLISRLLVAKNAVTPTYISKSYLNIYKR